MNKKLALLFLLHFSLLHQSQTKPPESYSLMRGVNENINLNRGLVDLSIPLFDISEGGFKFSNSLNYESRGFVPYLYPSYVGLNWNLNQFGKITRESKKIDLTTTTNKIINPFYGDSTGNLNELHYSSFQYDDVRSYDRNDCIKTIYANNPNKQEIFNDEYYFLNYYATNQFGDLAGYHGKSYNFRPDKYYFDFMGYKGYFVVDNNMKPIVHCENASLKVDISGVNCYDIFGNITFSQFVIHDDKGNQYFFGGNTDALDINFSYNRFTYNIPLDIAPFVRKGSSSNRTNYIDSWLLKKVVLANGTEINAHYRPNDLTILNNYRGTYSGYRGQEDINFTQENGYVYYINENTGFPTKQSLLQNNLSIKHSRSLIPDDDSSMETQVDTYTKMAVLDSIKINDVTVEYKYHNTLNLLELSNNYLDEITVKRKNKFIKKINLIYEELGNLNKRTFLKQVKHSADEKIGFDYYNTDDFPAYKNSAVLTHIGGIWNGSHSIYNPPTSTEYNNSYDTGLLKKVTHPTKGSITYSYELSDISTIMAYYKSLNGIGILDLDYRHSLNAPRLKKKVEKSSLSDSLVTKYDYLNDNGLSSGVLEAGKLYTYAMINSTYLKNIGPVSPNTEGLVKYSVAKVSNEGKGFNKMYFSNYLTNPDTLSIRSYGRVTEYLSKSNERGKLLKEQIYSNNNTLLRETTYKYKNFLNKLPTITNDLSSTNAKVSDLNYFVETSFDHSRHNDNSDTYEPLYKMYVPVIPYLQSSQTTKEYFGNKVIETTTQTGYLDKVLKTYTEGASASANYIWYPYPKESSFISASGSATKKFLYPIDLYNENPCISCNDDNSIVGGQYNSYKQLHYKNIFTPVIEISRNNKNKFSLQENVFTPASGMPMIKTTRTSLLNAAIDFTNYKTPIANTEDDVTFDLYDNRLNPIQTTNKSGITTVTIWGYNQSLPIAVVTGIGYEQLMEVFGLAKNSTAYLSLDIVSKSEADKDAASESLFLNALDIFRNNPALSNYQITTYTYNPLIGVTSITPSSGIRENYIYDIANRLEKIVDSNGKILKEFQYNYKPNYSSKKSQVFTRTNCGPGTLPEPITYVVPEGKYTSKISQEDADQKAQNDITVNGQAYANANGVCKPYVCTITPTHLADIYYSSFQETAFGHIKVILSFPKTGYNGSTPNWSDGVFIGTLDSLCRPYSYKSANVTSNGGSWSVSIGPAGDVTVRSTGGNSGSSATLYFEYDKN
ncbi:MAG: DUF5977 domain-containing protein [Chryseobacterium jejuense]|uniref:DUF5977 domain-containing protein n=1 Tax=Chryseobacterium jejuense TaxID=445960 RepID=UPI003D12E439